ncbi:MAG: ice-binding family protein [Nitrososphaeria archaeon]|jgi:hypothetical protein
MDHKDHQAKGYKTYKIGLFLILALLITVAGVPYYSAHEVYAATVVNLGTAGNYVILAETTITNDYPTYTSSITGNLGISTGKAAAITGFALVLDSSGKFSTSSQVIGKVYASDYASPTPTNLSTAVGAMGSAYTTANGLTPVTFSNFGTPAGTIPAGTLTPGIYKWTSPSPNVVITGNIVLSGGPSAVWIFQIPGTFDVDTDVTVTMGGGATYNNVFWVVGGQTTIHAGVTFNGIILDGTSIAMQDGATLNGRLLAQAAVTLIGDTIAAPVYNITVAQSSGGTISPGNTTVVLGGSQSFSVTPNVGYYIASITVNGSPVTVTSPAGQTVNITNVLANESITATFASASVGGVIAPSVLPSALLSLMLAMIILVPVGYLLAKKRNGLLGLITRLHPH